MWPRSQESAGYGQRKKSEAFSLFKPAVALEFLSATGRLMLLLCTAFRVVAAPDAQEQLPQGLRLQALDGQPVDPFGTGATNTSVFIFVSVECPISNSYMPEYQRLQREFKAMSFWLIYANSDESAAAIRKHVREYDCAIPALRDPRHDLVKCARVRITPEAAVFVPGRGLVYHGRIDNRYVELGRAKPSATVHDLRDALAACAAGKSPPRASSPPVGCYISGSR